MQHPNLAPSIKSVCTTTSAATSSNPVFIIETYVNGTSWYRKYSDGTIVQGGFCTEVKQDKEWSIPFVTPFTTANAKVFITSVFNGNLSNVQGGAAVGSVYTDSFTIHGDTYISVTAGYYWEATGV